MWIRSFPIEQCVYNESEFPNPIKRSIIPSRQWYCSSFIVTTILSNFSGLPDWIYWKVSRPWCLAYLDNPLKFQCQMWKRLLINSSVSTHVNNICQIVRQLDTLTDQVWSQICCAFGFSRSRSHYPYFHSYFRLWLSPPCPWEQFLPITHWSSEAKSIGLHSLPWIVSLFLYLRILHFAWLFFGSCMISHSSAPNIAYRGFSNMRIHWNSIRWLWIPFDLIAVSQTSHASPINLTGILVFHSKIHEIQFIITWIAVSRNCAFSSSLGVNTIDTKGTQFLNREDFLSIDAKPLLCPLWWQGKKNNFQIF